MSGEWSAGIEVIRLLLEVLLVPIVAKIWSMDVRMSKIETVIERRGDNGAFRREP